MILDLHHAEPSELRERTRELEEQFADRDDIEISATSSRNELLSRISARPSGAKSVALIDLRVETGDIEQSGLRIVSVIRANAALAAKTIPVIWTDHVSNANASYASASGARALISDAWVDVSSGRALRDAIETVSGSADGDFLIFPPQVTHPDGVEELEDSRRAENFERWFDQKPEEIHFHLLWGLANGVEHRFLHVYLAEIGVVDKPSASKSALYDLQMAMRRDIETLDRPEFGNPEIARRFLAELMPPDADPIPELNWPRISTIQELLLDNHPAVGLSFATESDIGLLSLFLAERTAHRAPGSRPTAAELHQSIEDAVKAVARIVGTPYAQTFNRIHLTAHSIDDAYWDLRRFGSPSASADETA